jgi:hypothetical protein
LVRAEKIAAELGKLFHGPKLGGAFEFHGHPA